MIRTKAEALQALADNDAERRRVNGRYLERAKELSALVDSLPESALDPGPLPTVADLVPTHDASALDRELAQSSSQALAPEPEPEPEPEVRDTEAPPAPELPAPHREDFASPAAMIAAIALEIAPAEVKAGWVALAHDWQLELTADSERQALAELQAEIDAKVASCTHEPDEHGVCALCGALRHDDGEGWEPPLAQRFLAPEPSLTPDSVPHDAENSAESEAAVIATSAPAESA